MKNQFICFLFLFMILLATAPAFSANPGDFRTKANGNWNQVSIWEFYNGSSWIAATSSPTSGNEQIDVLSGYSVTVTFNATIDQTHIHGTLTINSGVTLTINDGSGTDMAIYSPVTVNGTVVNHGTISGTAAEFVFNSGSLYQHSKDGGSLPDATWNVGSVCEITGVTGSTSISNLDQSFYHFKWNCLLQTAETNCAGNLQTIRGDFFMISTGSTGKFKLGDGADYTLTISGNWDHQGGTLNMGGGTSWAYINLSGNFSMSAGKITETNSSGYYSRITFIRQGVQNYVKNGGTFENNIDFDISSGTTLEMGDNVVDGSLGQFSVSSGSTLRTSNLNGISNSGASGCIQTTSRYYSFAANYHYNRVGAQSTGNGLPSPFNGKLMIGSATAATNLTLTNGSITINGTLLLCSSTLSNSTIASGTVTYGSGGALEYQGMISQTTTVKEWPPSSSPDQVIINNGYGVNLDSDRSISTTLTLGTGFFSIGAHTLTLNGALVRSSGSLTGGSGSNISIGGSSLTALDLPDVTLGNLLLNRSSGVRLTGNITIYGIMTMTTGAVTQMSGKTMSYMSGSRLKYNGSINQTTNTEEFPSVNGPPSLEVDKTGGTTLNLNFSRSLSENLYLTNGNLSIGSNTLTLNGLINTVAGTLTGGSSSNIFFGGSGLATTLPTVTLNDLTINRSQGIYMGGNTTISGTLNLSLGALNLGANTLTINGSLQYDGGSLEGGVASSLTVGGSGGLLSLDPITLGTLILNRGNGISLTGDIDIITQFCMMNGSISRNGNSIYGSAATLRYQGTSLQTTSDEELPETNGPCYLQIVNPAGVNLHADRTIQGNLLLDAGSFYLGNHTLTLNGSISRIAGKLQGGGTGNLVFGPGPAPGVLPAADLNNLTIDRTAGVILNGYCTIRDTLLLTNGSFTVGAGQTLNLNGYPIAGNPLNLKTNNLSRLFFGGTQPGFVIPTSVSQIGSLTVANLSGVSLESDLDVQGGTTVIQRFVMNDHVVYGSGFFSLMPLAQLVIGHPDGVAGNIQVTGPVTLDSDADYEFNGVMDQVTGFLPTSTPNTIRNLTISNTEPNNVILNNDITLTGNLDILQGAKFTVDAAYELVIENDLVVH